MSVPLGSGCPRLQQPAAVDIIGLVCNAYKYGQPWCNFSPTWTFAQTFGPDADGDGWEDEIDNCPTVYNPLQEDLDSAASGMRAILT
jgi:hypothetical protein